MKANGKFLTPPTLAEVFDIHSDDIGSKLRVAIPGHIVSYDATKRTASIAIGENLVLNDGTVIDLKAPLVDVPVFTLRGAGIHIGMPIGPGDECLVIFADFNIDAWHSAGGQQTPPTTRQHDISDGFAFVGPSSLAKPIVTALTATEGGISSATAKVAIDKATNLVTIAGATTTLKAQIDALLDALTLLNNAIAAESAAIPTAATAATTANATIVTIKAALATVLY